MLFRSYNTQNIITEFFKDINIKAEKVINTGVVATMNSGNSCIAIRADMDALPVNGVSHVCGHDYHMAIVLGTAFILKKLGYKKAVKFIFEPGEETTGGADLMIKAGALLNPKVNHMIGFHVWPDVPVGTIEVASEASMASVDDFNVKFKGKGGHAATPHLCINPMYPAMEFIQSMNIQSNIANNPLDSHVMTFSAIQCGNANNVIADECEVLGTVRTFNSKLRNKLHDDILKHSRLCAEKYGCTVKLDYDFQYPPLISDEVFTNKFIDITKKLIGENNVSTLEKSFTSDDFAFFSEMVPSVHFRLGIKDESKGVNFLHSSNFDASEDAILNGIYIITNFILSLEY